MVELDEEKLPPPVDEPPYQTERMNLLNLAREWFVQEFPGCTISSIVLYQPERGNARMDDLRRTHEENLRPLPSLMLATEHLLD